MGDDGPREIERDDDDEYIGHLDGPSFYDPRWRRGIYCTRQSAYSGATDEMEVKRESSRGAEMEARAILKEYIDVNDYVELVVIEDTVEVWDLTSDSDDEVVGPIGWVRERSPWLMRMIPRKIRYQFWKSRLSERFSPEREGITWEGEILGYTGGFSPERELSRLGEK
ncbi:hypothetical protein Lal_00027841 [Lupinus albus]|nr:hypothetical protein Lal_00027841 [Lupinus albus]